MKCLKNKNYLSSILATTAVAGVILFASPVQAAFEFVSPITPEPEVSAQSEEGYEPAVSDDQMAEDMAGEEESAEEIEQAMPSSLSEPLPPLPGEEGFDPVAESQVVASVAIEESIEDPVFINNDQTGAVIKGFAKDVPLVLAVTQIVPPDYRFIFDETVDPGQTIDWDGGVPWTDVLKQIAQENNLSIAVSDGVTYIKRRESENFAEYFVPLADGQTPPPAPSAVAMSSLDEEFTPAEVNEGPENPNLPIPLAQVDELPGLEGGPVAMPGRPVPVEEAGLTPMQVEDMSFGAPVPLLPEISGGEPMMSRPGESYDMASLSGDEFESSAVQPTTQTYSILDDPRNLWKADAGQTLREILKSWSDELNISLVWSAQYDYPLQTAISIEGSFVEAVQTILDGLSESSPRPLGRIHKNQDSGKAVLVIETDRLTG